MSGGEGPDEGGNFIGNPAKFIEDCRREAARATAKGLSERFEKEQEMKEIEHQQFLNGAHIAGFNKRQAELLWKYIASKLPR